MDKMLRILILEDCASDIDLVEFELQEAGIAYTALKVMSEKEFIGALQPLPKRKPDVRRSPLSS